MRVEFGREVPRLASPPPWPYPARGEGGRRTRAITSLLAVFLIACQVPAHADGPPRPANREAQRAFALAHPGEPEKGRALFEGLKPTACSACHKAQGQGGDAGPDLSDIGNKFGRPHLVESVLEPSRQVVEGYRSTLIETADGRVLRGVIRDETADGLALIDAQAKAHSLTKAEVTARRVEDTSPMPEGLADGLSPEDFAHLIAYLEGLRPGRKVTPGERREAPLSLPKGFDWEVMATGLSGATALEVAPDGRVFVGEQAGALRVVKGDTLLSEPFATLDVDPTWERGLIGVTVHPDFPRTPYVYVCTVVGKPHPHHVIRRLTADGDRAVPGRDLVLFEGDDQTKLGGKVPSGHQGGAIHFGRDGMLYVGIGEQTAETPSQDLHSLLGKLLRIGPDGAIPTDNPFAGRTEGKYRAIYALGLRNPFTFAVQPGTGRIFANDVGGKAEEVNEIVAGGNYGWPTVEHGPTDDPRFRGPIHHYPTASISGAAFCPDDPRWPEEFRDRYFFMDFVRGWIKALDPDRPDRVETFATGLARPVDLRFSADGSLYVLLRDAWVIDREFRPGTGSLLKIRPPSPGREGRNEAGGRSGGRRS